MNPVNISTLTDEQLAGQRLMVGFEGRQFNPDLKFLIGDLKVGGIILF
jgi:beta-N-acetylhexosaminidase